MSAINNSCRPENIQPYRNWLLVYTREQKGYSVVQLARKSGIAESLLFAIEEGTVKMSFDHASYLGKHLNISPHYLYMSSVQLMTLRICTNLFYKEKERMDQQVYTKYD